MRRVLVVEDSVSSRAFVRAVLESTDPAAGFEVVEARSGFEAMRLLPRGPYDLIITDLNMGDINGLELIRFVRGSGRHSTTPLIIISTLRAENDIARGLALGADAFLPKPFTAEQLREACIGVLSDARSQARPQDPPPGAA